MIQFMIVIGALVLSTGLSFVMKPMSRTIWTVGLFVACIALAWGLYDSIAGRIQLQAEIKASEVKVVNRLKQVRIAQEAYLKQYGIYAPNWEELERFVKEDIIYNIQRTEVAIPRDPSDPDYYKGDIIEITYDTIGTTLAQEKLFPAEEYPNFKPAQLKFIPGTEPLQTFDMSTRVDSTTNMMAGAAINYIEVIDKHPVDVLRSDENDNPNRRFIRFGSMESPNTSGNWE